mgnify:FL=1
MYCMTSTYILYIKHFCRLFDEFFNKKNVDILRPIVIDIFVLSHLITDEQVYPVHPMATPQLGHLI